MENNTKEFHCQLNYMRKTTLHEMTDQIIQKYGGKPFGDTQIRSKWVQVASGIAFPNCNASDA